LRIPSKIATVAFLCHLQIVAQVLTLVCLPFSCQPVVVVGASQTGPERVKAAAEVVGSAVTTSGFSNFLLHAGSLSQFAGPGNIVGIGAGSTVGSYRNALGTDGFINEINEQTELIRPG
jgi:hypothetical protein